MKGFVDIDSQFLASNASDSERIPRLYYASPRALRRFFWMRLRLLYALLGRYATGWNRCLDF